MSWYDNWSNWLNTTIRVLNSDCNQNYASFYFFKSNSYYNKQYYRFGRVEHWEHKMKWNKKHRGRHSLI